MPTHCTCGAQLPADALFCHKCGRPLYDLLPPSEEEEVQPPPAPAVIPPVAPPLPTEINFHNPAAVRSGLITAVITSVLSSLPIPPQGLWLLISLLLAGFLAVFLYVRRTGQSLTVVAGARMGWITGIFSFAIATIFFTLTVLLVTSRGGFASLFREQLQGRVDQKAELEQFLQMMQNPAALGVALIMSLAILFVLFTIFPTLGGALGAKVFERDRA